MFEKMKLSPESNSDGIPPQKPNKKSREKKGALEIQKLELTLAGSLLPADGIQEIINEMAQDRRQRFHGKIEAEVLAESLPRTKSNPRAGSEAYLAVWKYYETVNKNRYLKLSW